jgi:TRAP transporter TAXI family solute receptor
MRSDLPSSHGQSTVKSKSDSPDRVRRLLVSALALSAFSSSARGEQDRAPIEVTLTGVAVAGGHRLLVEAISTILRDSYPGSAVTFKPTTPAGGLQMVAERKADITFAAGSPEIDAALRGSFPFTTSLRGKLDWLAFIQDDQVFYFVADKAWAERYGIRTLEDIARKKPPVRIGNNRKGNLQIVTIAEDIFNACGFSSQDIDRWGGSSTWVPGPQALEQLADGKVDLLPNANFFHWAAMSKLAESRQLVWLDVPRDKLESVARKWGYDVAVIPKDSYPFADTDKATIRQWTNAVVGSHVPDATVVKVLAALSANVERLRAITPAMSEFSLRRMAMKPTRLIPYHPAAEAFYRSKGVLPA